MPPFIFRIAKLPASYQLSRSAVTINEGLSFTITLTTAGVMPGTSVPYTITGVTSSDISGAPLTGTFVVSGDFYASTDTLVVNVSADLTTEGPETLTLTIDGTAAIITVGIVDTSGSGDPYFADVVMLHHFDGTNNSTVMPDSSALNIGPNIVNLTGPTVLDTALPKFGTASMKWSNYWGGPSWGSAFIAWPHNAQRTFGTGDFTIEFWVQNTGFGSYGIPYLRSTNTGYTQSNWYLGTTNAGKLVFNMYTPTNTIQFSMTGGASHPALATNTWGFVTLTRKNGVFNLWLNGQQAATPYTTYTGTVEQLVTTGSILVFGEPNGGGNGTRTTTGHLDELRITKGTARYDAPFSVPTESFKAF